jgi:hypothetical protein
MSPTLRKKLHELFDLALDAIAEEATGEGAGRKRRPYRPPVIPPMPDGLSEKELADVEKAIYGRLERDRLKKAG